MSSTKALTGMIPGNTTTSNTVHQHHKLSSSNMVRLSSTQQTPCTSNATSTTSNHSHSPPHVEGANNKFNSTNTTQDPSPIQIKRFERDGITYVTSPVIHKKDTYVFWMHHLGLRAQVQVLDVVVGSQIDYEIALLTDMSTHHASREQHFLVKKTGLLSSATIVHDTSQLAATSLSAIQQLVLKAYPSATPADIKHWDHMDLEKLSLSSFKKGLAYESVVDNSIQAIQLFYQAIAMSCQAAHKCGAVIFPEFSSLKPTNTFVACILPPDSYQIYSNAIGLFNAIGCLLHIFLLHLNTTAHSPLASRGVQMVAESNTSRWERLFSILKNSILHLGAIEFNPQKMIDELVKPSVFNRHLTCQNYIPHLMHSFLIFSNNLP